jgi:D-beta-D-heptose 7-phosphate kinase/D-beta-D-heptose 1-phosphate adenosyltransferase
MALNPRTAVNAEPAELIAAFARLSVLVVGEAMLDCFLQGASERLCPEAPVPVVAVDRRLEAPGGAANTAANLRALGARVSLLSVVGEDGEGALLRRLLAERGVDASALIDAPGRRTLAKHRVLAGPQMLVRFDHGSTDPLEARLERAVAERAARLFAAHDAVVISDYGYGVLGPRVIRALAALQARAPRVVVADARTLSGYRGVGVTAVKPNFVEAVRLLEARPRAGEERAAFVARHGARLLELTGARIAAVTLDVEGALFLEHGRSYRTYALPVDQARAAGAGDTLTAALALALAAGAELPAAAELAAAAAAVVVAKDGTAMCSATELEAAMAPAGKFLGDARALAACLARHRGQGRRVVLASGCFDLLHPGHIAFLTAAKAQGDILIVGLNSDASVARLKGPERPINELEARVALIAALSAVDHIVAFDEDTPAELLQSVRPDIFVKGGDYTRDMLPEAPLVEALGGQVRILPYVQARSTTSLIARIRAAPGAV